MWRHSCEAPCADYTVLTTLQLYISSNFRPLDLSLSWVARPTGLKTVLTMSLLSRPGRYSAPTAARAGAGGEEAADGSSSAEDGGAAKEGGVGVEAREVGRCGGCCCACAPCLMCQYSSRDSWEEKLQREMNEMLEAFNVDAKFEKEGCDPSTNVILRFYWR